MLTTKYVRHKWLGFILWDSLSGISHQQMTASLGWEPTELHSAGFVGYASGMPYCTGMSGSLALGSAPGDTAALHRQLGVQAA